MSNPTQSHHQPLIRSTRSSSSSSSQSIDIIIDDQFRGSTTTTTTTNSSNRPIAIDRDRASSSIRRLLSTPSKILFFVLSRRKLSLFLLSLIPILLCLSSLSLIAIRRGLIDIPIYHPNSSSISTLNLIDHRYISSSAHHLSSHLIDWFDSVPDRLSPYLSPLHAPFSLGRHSNLSSSSSSSSPPPSFLQLLHLQSPHPILHLLLKSRQSWKSTLRSQPTSLERARLDYRKAFHPLKPPPGFDQWYQFACDRNFTLINSFDGLMADLAPFRNLTPAELIRRTRELIRIPGITHVRIDSKSFVQVQSPSGRFAAGQALKQIIDRIITQSNFKLPPIDLAINEHTEARILPRQTRPLTGQEFYFLNDSVRKQYQLQDPEREPSLAGFKPEWGRDGNVWDAYRRACPPDSSARRLVETVRSAESQTGAVAAGGGLSSTSSTQTHLSSNRPTRLRALHPVGTAPLPSPRELTFLSDLESVVSFCDRPSTHHLHSAFFADQRSIEHLYPLFSPSKPQGFSDILIPSYYHYSPTLEYVYEADMRSGRNSTPTDSDWNDKANKMYWRGKLTRGANTPPGHTSSFQKQRLVKLVSNDTGPAASLTSTAHKQGVTDPSWRAETSRVLVYLNVTSESLLSVSAPATTIDPLLLDIAMACDPNAGECQELSQHGYHVQPPAPISEVWKAKMALDLDDTGFSPSFGALMESRSALVKMSVHQEFWRDWIQPWYHFIPLSSSYAELHNLITFFLGVPDALKDQMSPIKSTSPINQNNLSQNLNDQKLRRRSIIPEGNQTLAGPNADNLKQNTLASDGQTADPRERDPGLEAFDSDDELRKIGENGRDWKLRHLRQEDMEVYVFRLLIEWARILNPDSSSSSIHQTT